eukprot:16490-Heterococcus_DN1.PRE.1
MLRARSARVPAALQRAVLCARAATTYPAKWTKLATNELKGKEPSTLEKATAEGITLKPVYTDPDKPDHVPGVFPYTRGPYATMYTARCVAFPCSPLIVSVLQHCLT